MSREYPTHPRVGVGVAVLRPGAVLLARRGTPPNAGSWSLPGGGQELGETTEQTARRELAEETGLTVGELHLAGVVDSITTNDAQRVRYHYTIIDYAALWQGDTPTAGSDITEIAWAALDRLDAFDLSQEARRIIERAVTEVL